MIEEISVAKGFASLRHLFPTLWYFAADAPKIVEPLRALTYSGLTRPWSFIGAAMFLFTFFHKKLVDAHLNVVRGDDFTTWSWEEKIDIWVMLVLPFIISYYVKISSKVKEPPPFTATVALWLYIFGIYVLVFLALGDLVSLAANRSYEELPLLLKILLNVTALYLFFFRSAWVILLLHKSEEENEVGDVLWGVLAAAGTAFGCFVAAAFFFNWIKWYPSRLFSPVVSWFTG